MAGDWIKMRNDLSEDPAVIGIAARVGIDEFAVVGRLQCLWAWADVQSRDGHAPGVTASWIDRKVQRDGFASAMCAVNWLVINDAGISFPNFENHNGETAKARALGANRKKKQRANEAVVTAYAGHVSRTQRDIVVTKSVTREEKRREEKKDNKEGFDSFWTQYPNKTAKANAIKAWSKVPAELHPEIMTAVAVQKSSPAWTKDNGQFVPHAATWLNGRRWEDQAAVDTKTFGIFEGAL